MPTKQNQREVSQLSIHALLIDLNACLGNERSEGHKLNQDHTLTVTKYEDRALLTTFSFFFFF